MDFRRQAIELYRQGKDIKEINKKIGFQVEEDIIKKWDEEDSIKSGKLYIFKLDNKQRKEKDYDKRKAMLIELKKKLEDLLEMLPNDISLETKLMYTNINLKQIEEAKELGDKLIKVARTKEILNGVAIIEEKLGNYDKAIDFIEEILEKEPYNQYLKNKTQRIQNKKEIYSNDKNKKDESQDIVAEKDLLYRKIATLERSVINFAEEQPKEKIVKGRHLNSKEEYQNYVEVYKKVKELVSEILQKYPEEIVAKEKLIKSLFITNEIQEAEKVAQELLENYETDEIALLYMSKIERAKGNMHIEKQYLEKIIDNADVGTQIKAQKRLQELKKQIEKEEIQKELNDKLMQERYTEEARIAWLANIQKAFLYGNLSKKSIENKIIEAKKYPNYTKSFIALLDIESKMTENDTEKIQALEDYIDTRYSLTPEEYHDVLNEIAMTRQQNLENEQINALLDKKENKERYDKSNQQRQYSKQIVKRLNSGEITEDELPEIIKTLQNFPDRAKSIFLITKLYEIVKNKEEAYKKLIQYTTILNLSPSEKRQVAEMQSVLKQKERCFGATHKIKGIYQKKKEKLVKKVNKEEIIQHLEAHESVQTILEALKDKGVSLKSVARIKSFYLKSNPEYQKENERIVGYARNLLQRGYKIPEVYDIMEYDVPILKLQELEKQIQSDKEDIEK